MLSPRKRREHVVNENMPTPSTVLRTLPAAKACHPIAESHEFDYAGNASNIDPHRAIRVD
jgi:hypothetical protein